MQLIKTAHDTIDMLAPAQPLDQVPFDHQIVANEYGFYCLPETYMPREVPRTLAQGSVYEPDTLKFMGRLLRGGGDVITGGAFVGDFLPALSQSLAPRARAYSFEPNPISCDAALHTLFLNRIETVSLFPCAIGDDAGTVHLQVSKADGRAMAGRSRIVADSAEGKTIEAPVRTIDALVDSARPVTLIQLDLEGHEAKALTGAANVIRASKPYVIVEADRPAKRRRIGALLAEMCPDADYVIAGMIERNAIFLPRAAH
ncbi:FkbM family methyltransferase [Tateyamaria sp. ANG-S1]|uniref:FkbM family methyltransferase n=1 Tax=Tateyamaria sp. ANG-S1 TaxID=1577905 RepID=UPI00057E9050|nr:FkbM family methyltransferase [Tateyamaria sp. ANG-S1]KIC50354.1 hypothetical protein RA29_06470 [Tateyamaria sp. ANG-S1]